MPKTQVRAGHRCPDSGGKEAIGDVDLETSCIASVLLGSQREKAEVMRVFLKVRSDSLALVEPLQAEDMQVQSMPDVSPSKWHLAHTSWFFQNFLLDHYAGRSKTKYQEPPAVFAYLYNSYYMQVGHQYPRPQRGMISRPLLQEVLEYRAEVDQRVLELMEQAPSALWPELAERIVLGLHHEQQHQELMLTDIKHVLSVNPCWPVAYPQPPSNAQDVREKMPQGQEDRVLDLTFTYKGEALVALGRSGCAGFGFDCETPEHSVFMPAFELADRYISNREYVEFIDAGGYDRPEYWVSDGWIWRNKNAIKAPLYWHRDDSGQWYEFTLHGLLPLEMTAPVSHVSWYEAQAYASFVQARLPTEAELEIAGRLPQQNAPLVKRSYRPSMHMSQPQLWSWSSSPFVPYAGYRKEAGAIGEYNGKFMSSQMVLKGGSCLTPPFHMRSTYRNFFPPSACWQATGIRLARSVF
ncbi:MAG: ergothioneine biosynthesis protein EgtB [Gammaproteobacteria bacterium]